MKTYQDLQEQTTEKQRMEFCMQAIREHASDPKTQEAEIAEQYFNGLNVTIERYDKFITDVYGQQVKDIWSPNHKIKCHLYPYFITQSVLTLLGNGISFSDESTLEKLGKKFEHTMMKLMIDSLNGGIAFGFWNLDHLERFKLTEFVPLYDEETGRLSAGIRWWQMNPNKPLRITLFEIDGVTEYIKRKNSDIEILVDKKPYVSIISSSATGTEIAQGEPYAGFPIIPLENINGKSAIYGNRDTLDAYDLIASKLVNNIDGGEFIYWIIKNAPYMQDDPTELQAFLQKLRTSGVVATGEGQEVDSHTVEIPVEATDSGLEFLRKQLFSDFMAFDPESVSGGADTATRIIAAYEPLNEKLDLLEYQVTEFIENLLALIGIDDVPTYTRSIITNKAEEIQNVIQAASFTSEDYTTQKLLELLGDADKVADVLQNKDREEYSRFSAVTENE